MKTYSEVAMIVNGNKTCKLEIYKERNTFNVYENDENVYSGGWIGMTDFVNMWKAKWQIIYDILTAQGMKVEWCNT